MQYVNNILIHYFGGNIDRFNYISFSMEHVIDKLDITEIFDSMEYLKLTYKGVYNKFMKFINLYCKKISASRVQQVKGIIVEILMVIFKKSCFILKICFTLNH